MHSSKVIAACIFNELQAVGLFLAFGSVSAHTDLYTSGKKYCKLVNNAVFICNKSYKCIPIRAHAAVAKKRMPQELSIKDYRIWENISHVGLWGILQTSI